jgi:histidinol dehydrogenase
LSQAEHVQAAAILVTTDMAMAQAVKAQLVRQLAALPDNSGAAKTLMLRSGIVVVPDMATAFTVANAYAPEHLCLLIDHAWDYLGWVRNAGGVFIGEQSFEVLGDYIACRRTSCRRGARRAMRHPSMSTISAKLFR